MGDANKQKKEKRNNVIKKIIDISLALAIAGAAIYGVRAVVNDFSDIDRTPQNNSQSASTSTDNSSPNPNAVIYVTEMKDNDEIHSGSLILVNNKTKYTGNEKTLISMYDVKESDGTEDYLVMNTDVKLRVDAATELNKMIKDFAKETGKKDIIVDGGYRSVEYQQELYDAAEDKSTAAEPGTSDYHTGYSIDLGISAEDGSMTDFTAEGDYGWFEKNCYKYGFVIRFPEGKKDITGYDYRPWHFRYVGHSHAYYMQKNNLCLEEYLEKLKTFEYTQTHLVFNDDNGNEYETYYYPIDQTGSTTILAVPSANYEISGNNSDGFIISYQTNISVPEVQTSTESATKAASPSDNAGTEAAVSEDTANSETESTEIESSEENPE